MFGFWALVRNAQICFDTPGLARKHSQKSPGFAHKTGQKDPSLAKVSTCDVINHDNVDLSNSTEYPEGLKSQITTNKSQEIA